ncbi:MAG: DUF87 domain-containing protein [Saccharofermentans sp.]|nr:DUF87 domain-containing protein [Saccharofermentans sp.]
MGVVASNNIIKSGGNKVKGALKKAGDIINNTIARKAALSPEELKAIEDSRDRYLQGKPDPTDPAEVALTMRLMAANSIEIYNAYLPLISSLYYPVQPEAEFEGTKFDYSHNIRYFNITKWVIDKEEKNLEKLVNVYESLSNENCNIALVFHREIEKTNVYLAVTNNKNADDNSEAQNYIERLKGAIRGNFPGSRTGDVKNGTLPCMGNNRNYSVASVTNIPTEKSEKFISQTIEKLLDGIVPEKVADEYVLILLATPIDNIEERKLRLGEIYSGLKPYESWQTNYTVTEQDTRSSMATAGVNIGASAGIQNGTTAGTTTSNSTADSTQNSRGTSESRGDQTSTQTSNTTQSSRAQGINQATSNSINEGGSTGVSQTNTRSVSSGSNVNRSWGTNENYSYGEHLDTSAGPISGGSNYSTSNGNSFNVARGTNYGRADSVADATSSTSTWSRGLSETSGTSQTLTTGESIARSLGRSAIRTVGSNLTQSVGRAVTSGLALAEGVFKSNSLGINFGANFARSSTVTASVGKNDGITQTHVNYNVKHALELLENQMKRYDKSTAMGMWDFAAYVIGENQNVVSNVAHSYLGLTQGEESYMSSDAVNLWRGDVAENEASDYIYEYLKELRHPVFGLNPDYLDLAEMNKDENTGEEMLENDDFYNGDLQSMYCYPTVVTATTPLSGKELAYSLNFPQKSLAGLPVIQCARFGRNINLSGGEDLPEDSIKIGNIFHMDNMENNSVSLSLNSLASHTFITGSTGAGKSNTVYQILNNAAKEGVKFLVVEPTKGEYKNIFGNNPDVEVYGTNPSHSKLLRLNPFSFPMDIHVLEHIDRLTEIFNVCWPMYAAMPAVLKRAIEKSYEDCGWNLQKSSNPYGNELYPCFADVTRNVRTIIDSSDYDTENKGAYKGSLVTRLSSLSTGLNEMIFTNNEIPGPELFDSNAIVDLSRVGSSETKSLLMGMIVLKLQEHRMAQGLMNADLNHITVLEEAHNLLKRTSTEQPAEGGNLLGKSVEMISNAIAEMRTYGEGFIIADQAPGLLDMAAIRNTNTKIILRLPDLSDRELVGKAANLNEAQITELAKLPRGIAAIYQNEWIEAVLCKVDKYEGEGNAFTYEPEIVPDRISDNSIRFEIAELLSEGNKLGKEQILSEIKPKLDKLDIDASAEVAIMRTLDNPPKEPRMSRLGEVMSVLFPEIKQEVSSAYSDATESSEWTESAQNALNMCLADTTEGSRLGEQTRRDIIQSIITYYVWVVQRDQAAVEKWYVEGGL